MLPWSWPPWPACWRWLPWCCQYGKGGWLRYSSRCGQTEVDQLVLKLGKKEFKVSGSLGFYFSFAGPIIVKCLCLYRCCAIIGAVPVSSGPRWHCIKNHLKTIAQYSTLKPKLIYFLWCLAHTAQWIKFPGQILTGSCPVLL